MTSKKNMILFAAFLVGIAQESQAMMRRFATLKLTTQMADKRAYANTMALLAVKDPYKVLGVNPSDSKSKIKENYRKLVRKHHPDAGGNAADFRQVREAYETIMAGGARTSSTAEEADTSDESASYENASYENSSNWQNMNESASNRAYMKNPKREHITLEEVLKYGKIKNLKGKITSIKDLFRKAESIISAELLDHMRLKIDNNFFEMLDELAAKGFQANKFLKTNKASIIGIVINQIEEASYDIQPLLVSLKLKVFTIDEFIQSLIIKFCDQKPSRYALVDKILKHSLMIKPRNQEQKIYVFINKILEYCYTNSQLEVCIMMYNSLVKNISLELKNNIENDINLALKKVMKFELESNIVSDVSSEKIHITSIEGVFTSLDVCVAAGFVNSFELFKELKEDFEKAIIESFTISHETGNLLLTFLQCKGIIFDDAFLQQLKTESFIEIFNKEILNLIHKNDFDQASKKMNGSDKNLTAKTKEVIVESLISKINNNQAPILGLLKLALKNNIATIEQLFKTKQFIPSKSCSKASFMLQHVDESYFNVSFLLQLLDECCSIEEYECIVAIIQHIEKIGLVKKEELIDKITELMLAKLSRDFSNYSWGLQWYITAVDLLLQNKIINENDIRNKLEVALPAKLVAILKIKKERVSEYKRLITTLRRAIHFEFITIQSFLNELFKSPFLTLEEKEQFKLIFENSSFTLLEEKEQIKRMLQK